MSIGILAAQTGRGHVSVMKTLYKEFINCGVYDVKCFPSFYEDMMISNKILSDFYNIDSGTILVDNKKISNRKLDVIYISQDVVLFDLSIRENLTLGKRISEEKILRLLEEAGLKEWFDNLEEGLDTKVGQKGIKLSAGQQQRLNIIRGILLDKDFYFFDEPTSNLDSESEEKIINMLNKYLHNKSYIIVSHRSKISSICNKEYIFKNHTMLYKKWEKVFYAIF